MFRNKKVDLSNTQIEKIIDLALAEDLAHRDITTQSLIEPQTEGNASLLVKSSGILAGTEIARKVFLKVDPTLRVDFSASDGIRVEPGQVIAEIKGNARSILAGERVALNFLQHLSGIATETARYVEACQGLPAKITDTRKTIPGLRLLEKYAVTVGGGINHRLHLGDGILIKDNHLAILRAQGLSIKEIITRARKKAPSDLKIEVEVKTPEEALEAAWAGADIVMLDNMSLEEMHQAIKLIKGRTLVEASGGVTLANVRDIAETGVDFISVGTLTHSPKALDMSLELELEGKI